MFSRRSSKSALKSASKSRIAKVMGALRTTATDASVTSLEQWSQHRRCHCCGATHAQMASRVLKCDVCGTHFAPFFYSELTPDALAIGAPESLVISSAKNFRPVVGITWWWHESNEESGEWSMPRA